MLEELICDVAGICVAPEGEHGIASCVYCGKELVERNGQWFTWDADIITANPRPQKVDSSKKEETIMQEVREARWLTDDRDSSHLNELIIYQGGNGDWYLEIAPCGKRNIGGAVRICTSGGAASRVPGLAPAVAAMFRALVAAGEGGGVTLKT